MQWISHALLAAILAAAAVSILIIRKKNLFDSFLAGAKDGLDTSVRLLPTLVALLTAVAMLNASGLPDLLSDAMAPVFDTLGIPSALVPLILTRPVSGSASTAVVNGLYAQYGADSFVGMCASVILGSSDTVIYIAGVYYGAVHIRRTRHTLPAAFLTMLFSIFISCLTVRLLFS